MPRELDPTIEAHLREVAVETGETYEIVRSVYDALICMDEEAELEEKYGAAG